jgi:hypothetical protein
MFIKFSCKGENANILDASDAIFQTSTLSAGCECKPAFYSVKLMHDFEKWFRVYTWSRQSDKNIIRRCHTWCTILKNAFVFICAKTRKIILEMVKQKNIAAKREATSRNRGRSPEDHLGFMTEKFIFRCSSANNQYSGGGSWEKQQCDARHLRNAI